MKEERFEQIEEYINGRMTPEERLAFESALVDDQQLERTLHLYRIIENEMKDSEKYDEEIAALKRTLQTLGENYLHRPTIAPALRWTIGVAACLVLLSGIWLSLGIGGPSRRTLFLQKQAANYTKTQLTHISRTMGTHPVDSLQQSIDAFNAAKYDKALPLLEAIIRSDSSNTDALNYSGRTWLLKKNFKEALLRFGLLANKKGLYSNPGKFLEAVTLLERDRSGDEAEARKLLQEVVNEKEEGSKEAALWLEGF